MEKKKNLSFTQLPWIWSRFVIKEMIYVLIFSQIYGDFMNEADCF